VGAVLKWRFNTKSVEGANPLTQRLIEKSIPVPHLLLVDDDASFTELISRMASYEHVPITICTSAKEVHSLSQWNFDVVVVNYDLVGDMNGLELIDSLGAHFRNIPVILIGQSRQVEAAQWPKCVKRFFPKAIGSYGILVAAFEAHEFATMDRRFLQMVESERNK